MLDHALASLEFDVLCGLVSNRALTPLGVERARSLQPSDDRETVLRLLEETGQARRALLAQARPPLSGTFDIRPHLSRARQKGHDLSGDELRQVASTFQTCGEARAGLLALQEGDFDRLRALGERIGEFRGVVSEVRRCIGPAGEVLATASEALSEIRGRIRGIRERVKGRLEKLVSIYLSLIHISEPTRPY